MTEVFRDARKDAGYCPKCQKGYAIGPHVCPSELPPSKERTAEPQFMRAYAFYLRNPAREHGLSQSYLDSLADELEAAANEIEQGRNAPELRRWNIEPAPFDGVDFKVSESGEWVRWEDVRPYLRTAYEPAASKERVSDEKLASLIEACDHNFDVSEQYGATDMSLWENLSEALEELKERRTAPVNWAIDALSTSHEPCPECEKRKHANDRVNYETTEDGFRICRGYHHRSADCEWEYYVRRPSQPPSQGPCSHCECPECHDDDTAPPPSPEWQPIETAPKDGTAFLAVSGNWIVCMCWNKHRRDWCTVDKHYCPLPEDETFTHWMPLPSPPTKEGGQ